METLYKISIIIPVYKVEPYIRQCLESVVNQTYQNLEIIIIDDGSPDNCGKICDEYAQNDNRIHVVHKENGGLSAGWNDGIAVSSGDWITFIDSDDWVDASYVERFIANVPCADKADVIVAGSYYEERGDSTAECVSFTKPFSFVEGKGKEYLQKKVFVVTDRRHPYDRMAVVWNKLYRADFLKDEGILFNIMVRAGLGNDVLFNYMVLEKAQTVCGINYAGYHYRILNSAGTRRFDPNRPKAVHYLLESISRYMNDNSASPALWEAFDAYAFTNILANLSLCYFHDENTEEYHIIAERIKEMKQMPLYKKAIYSKSTRYLTIRQRIAKFALRFPFVLPFKLWFLMKKKL